MNESIKSILSDEIISEIETAEQQNKDNPEAIYSLYIHIVSKELSGYDWDKYYVGKTSRDSKERWGHNGCDYGRSVFRNVINKYGWDNILHIVITTNLTNKEACNLEKKLIKHLSSNKSEYGYNRTEGGDGGNCKEIYPVKQYTLDGLYIATYNSAAEAARFLGFDKTHITRCCKHGGSSHGYMFSYEKETITKPFRRCNQQTVIQLTIDGKYVADYYSLNEAHLKSGLNTDNLLRCIKGRNKTAGGYKWKYLKDIDESEITDSFLLQKYHELITKEVFA